MLKHRSPVLTIDMVAIDIEGGGVQDLPELPMFVRVSDDALQAQGLGRVLEPPDPDNEPDHYEGVSPRLTGRELDRLRLCWLCHEVCVVNSDICGHHKRSSTTHLPRSEKLVTETLVDGESLLVVHHQHFADEVLGA